MTVVPPRHEIHLNTEQDVVRAQWAVPQEGDDLNAEILDVGHGIPVVFLHGLVGLNEHWESVVERSCHRVRCILFQLPLLQLRGDHCSVAGVEALTVRFLREYLDEPAVLVGNSFGGHIAVRIAIRRPERTRALVLAGASGMIEKSMVSDVQIRPSRDWLARKIAELFRDPRTHMRQADLDRAHKELSDRSNARAMVRLSRSARRDHLGDRLSEIRAPTLLIWGRQDIVTPPEAAEGFRRRIPDTRLVWLDECGHVPMVECADDFAEALLSFADELARPVPAVRAAPAATRRRAGACNNGRR